MEPLAMIALGAVLVAVVVLSIGLWHPARRRARAERENADPGHEWQAQATLAEMRRQGARAPEPGDEANGNG